MNVFAMMKLLPDLSDDGMKAIAAGYAFSCEVLAPHDSTFDVFKLRTRYDVPVFVFQGRADVNTAGAVSRWLAQIEARGKDVVIVENASHGAFSHRVLHMASESCCHP